MAILEIDIDSEEELLVNILRELNTTIGMVKTHKRLINAVKDTDKATSPLANEVIILEVAPPGADAINITPIANSGDDGRKIKTKNNAVKGKIMI